MVITVGEAVQFRGCGGSTAGRCGGLWRTRTRARVERKKSVGNVALVLRNRGSEERENKKMLTW